MGGKPHQLGQNINFAHDNTFQKYDVLMFASFKIISNVIVGTCFSHRKHEHKCLPHALQVGYLLGSQCCTQEVVGPVKP